MWRLLISLFVALESVSHILAVDSSCTQQNINFKETTHAFFRWRPSLGSRDIWCSRLVFGESTVIATKILIDPKNLWINKSYTKRCKLLRHSKNEIQFLLKTITKQDAGVYKLFIYTKMGESYCKKWNLTVVALHPITKDMATSSTTFDATGTIKVPKTLTKYVNQTVHFKLRFNDTGQSIRITRLYRNNVLIAMRSLKTEYVDGKYTNRYQFNNIRNTEVEFVLQGLDIDDTGQYEGEITKSDGDRTTKKWNLNVKAVSHSTDGINNSSTARPVAVSGTGANSAVLPILAVMVVMAVVVVAVAVLVLYCHKRKTGYPPCAPLVGIISPYCCQRKDEQRRTDVCYSRSDKRKQAEPDSSKSLMHNSQNNVYSSFPATAQKTI